MLMVVKLQKCFWKLFSVVDLKFQQAYQIVLCMETSVRQIEPPADKHETSPEMRILFLYQL